ncbi:ATP-binding protein [Acetivibrio clariflavus]|uniref:YhaN AAA domain-containing protein n=1 Tax=Acetivibrio clariflavus (strain DSM 19732 / NBRC 101661 / EBR45) TaxID=720554 RepID=G8LZD8_ACECE|nr:AAA family ATPase [Acetivibrio clariflavus]AEV66801.1 hypothetical protein Clocl_0043 [Acetivibrio clariflavus DSM 19732]
MRIDKLDIKGFGKFNNFEVEFDRGFNIVYGANESGKSTIQAFIKAMFYSLRGGRNLKGEDCTPLNKYRPWGGGEYRGSLRYTLDNGQVFTVERNFQNGETKIYDLLYKDITKTFDQSKDKGPLFAIKHIGLTESCFEKTLYIGQMATKIDNRDKKEILDSIANIFETGSEDISFINAREAIKEALKRYVGTDKTSTRPLDIINSKLVQLKAKKENLLKSKESLFSVEEEIAYLNNKRSKLEELKIVMQFARNIVNLREEIDVFKKRKKDLMDIVDEVSALTKELNNLRISLDECQKIKKRFENFSEFEFNEADDLYIKYAKYENLKDENTRLLEEIDKIKKSADENRIFIESLKVFEVNKDINVVDSTINTDFNLESIKRSEIQNKIKILKSKNRAMITAMTAIFLSAAALLFYSLSERNYYCIVVTVLLIAVFLAIGIFKSKNDRLLKQLTDEKCRLEKRLNLLLEKMEEKRLMQEEMFKMLEVNSMEEFIKKKALYDSKVYELDSHKKRMAALKEEVEKNCILIKQILQFIKEKLFASNVIDSIETEVKKEHIEAFRSSIYKYKETAAYLSNGESRLNDLYRQIENLYLRAYSICGQKIDNIEQLNEILNSMEEKIEKLYENLDIYAFKIKSIYSDMEFEGINYEKLMEMLLDLRIKDAKENMEEFTQKIFNEISSIQLNLKEKEIAQSALNDDNNELEKIEEEIRELELQKEKLEETGFSLKTALEVLEEANTEIKRDFAPVVNSNASKIISLITDFRYKELKVDENLVLRTTDPYIKDIIPVSVLSNGTVDQMYLALRIALVRTMEKKSEKLPIILDEVLSQYDEMRSINTIRMLKEISNERQVIFFTCKTRELDMAKSVCNNNLNVIKL